jgi:putative FmdB family regulatory protein
MPLYEYECAACGHRVEIIQKFSDGPPDACPKCGKGPLQRQQSSPAIQFKGTGWYVTDYAGKGKSGGDSGEKDAKPAAKSDSGSGTADSGSSGDAKKSGDTKKSDAPAPASTPSTSKD